MDSEQPKRWPIDFDTIQRGTILSVEDVERATLVSRYDLKAFDLARLKLSESIRQYFYAERGDMVTIINNGMGLRVLTHPEQAEYAPRRERKGIRQIRVAAAEGMAVDVSQLTSEQAQRLERWQLKNAFRIQALQRAPNPKFLGD